MFGGSVLQHLKHVILELEDAGRLVLFLDLEGHVHAVLLVVGLVYAA